MQSFIAKTCLDQMLQREGSESAPLVLRRPQKAPLS